MTKRFLIMAIWLAPFWAQAAQPLNVQTLDGRRITLSVELADTPEKQARGLMHVTHMPPKSGMVFPMQPPRQATFWMRNTMIPLDMIFILPGGIIGQIVTRLDTQSDALTHSSGKVSGVLELNAGEAAELNIGVGDTIRMNGVLF